MRFIKRETQAQKLTVAGQECPAIFSMQAIALLEDHTGTQHSFTLTRLETGIPSADEIVGLCYGMMTAAGVEVELQDLADSIRPADVPDLIAQIQKIVSDQKAEDPKNAKTPVNKGN